MSEESLFNDSSLPHSEPIEATREHTKRFLANLRKERNVPVLESSNTVEEGLGDFITDTESVLPKKEELAFEEQLDLCFRWICTNCISEWKSGIPGEIFHAFIDEYLKDKPEFISDNDFNFTIIKGIFDHRLKNRIDELNQQELVAVPDIPVRVLPKTVDVICDSLNARIVSTEWMNIAYWQELFRDLPSIKEYEKLRFSVRCLLFLSEFHKNKEKEKKAIDGAKERIQAANIIYQVELDNSASPIEQGDIFTDLPRFNAELFYQVKTEKDWTSKTSLMTEKENIFKDIMLERKPVQVEGFFEPTIGILASQNCDIRPEFDLVFYPLKETNQPYDSQNIKDFAENKIRKTTRTFYLPRIAKNGKEIGPFNVLYQNPFSVPFEVVKKNRDACWLARIIEPARQMFIGKLTSFYSRPPIEELIYLESIELTKFFEDLWREVWQSKKSSKWKDDIPTPKKIEEKIEFIKNAIRMLNFVNRSEKINQISFHDTYLIKKIYDSLKAIDSKNQYADLIAACEALQKDQSEDVAEKFRWLLDEIFWKEGNLLEYWTTPEITNALEKVKEGVYYETILESHFQSETTKKIQRAGKKISEGIEDLNDINSFIETYKTFPFGELIRN
ncbi:MAG: hypothetical protein ACFFD4_23030 [Candidatus Odinarchaeota archaeon]